MMLVMTLASFSAFYVWAEDLFVAAAASLTDVMKTVEPLYVREHPGVKLTFVYGSTGMLRTQLLKGAPGDVFIGAERWFGGTATNLGEVVKVNSIRIVAGNTLVAVAGKGTHPKGDSLAAWLNGAQKIGLGNPSSVPVGRYTKTLLESESLWEVNAPKCVQGTNVREVLLWLQQGVVDVGFVYGSDLATDKGNGLKVLAKYDAPGGTTIELAGGITKGTKKPADAQVFLDYMKSAEAVKVLRDFGFWVK
jgi:molybdate transport system substrate-binding protein